MSRHHSGNDFSTLRDFFSAYLHQDFHDEYDSPEGAAQAFREDANKEEVAAIIEEWKRWRQHLDVHSAAAIQQAVHELGAAWRPQTAEDIDRLGQALTK